MRLWFAMKLVVLRDNDHSKLQWEYNVSVNSQNESETLTLAVVRLQQ